MKIGHWTLPEGLTEVPSDSCCFVYLVNFPKLNKKYIGYKSIVSRKSGKPLKWQRYETSSKLVKRLLSMGNKADYQILKFFSSFSEGYKYECLLLSENKVLCENKEIYLNQRITHDAMLRKPESYTEETILAAKEGLLAYMESPDYKHPMLGKIHPNKGKKMPQTAPKKHVSKDNIQITNGILNKWWPKCEDIPDGFWRGISSRRVIPPEDAERRVEVMRQGNLKAMEKRITNYEDNPKTCKVCNSILTYQQRHWKTCEGECRSRYRSKISLSIKISEKSIKDGSIKRLNNLAISKGFYSYDEMCKQVVDMCKKYTIKQVANELNISITGIQGCMRYLNFSLSDYRKNQK